jgi:hypothetical protein
MVIRIENGKPTARWGRKARGLDHETARLPKPGPAQKRRPQPRKSRRPAKRVHWSDGIAVALVLPGLGTPAARIDPNRYGLRTVDAAGGSAATVAVKFTVRPVIVLVVDGSGAARQLWTNIAGRPTAAELAAVQARLDTPRGRRVEIDPSLRAQLPAILASAGWGRQGLIWRR